MPAALLGLPRAKGGGFLEPRSDGLKTRCTRPNLPWHSLAPSRLVSSSTQLLSLLRENGGRVQEVSLSRPRGRLDARDQRG
jgi:hypothetical protein